MQENYVKSIQNSEVKNRITRHKFTINNFANAVPNHLILAQKKYVCAHCSYSNRNEHFPDIKCTEYENKYAKLFEF